MKFPEYRLTALLGLRERKKEEAERYLGSCLAALKEEVKKLKEMEEELARMVADRKQRIKDHTEQIMRGEVSAQGAVNARKYIERLEELEKLQQEAIDGQKLVVKQHEEDVLKAREELLLAASALKALEKHKEKWEKEILKELQTKEDEIIDEVAQNVFLSPDNPGKSSVGKDQSEEEDEDF